MDRISVELRNAKIEGNRLTGLAHAFGKRALIGKRYEEMAPGAFDKALNSPTADVRAFFNHNPNMLLGRQGAGTVQVESTDEGLAFGIDLPDTSYANDLRELVKRGDVSEMSFAFIPGEVRLSRAPDGLQVRTHTSVKELIDISPVPLPAFTGTSLQLRSNPDVESVGSQLVRARARVHKESF